MYSCELSCMSSDHLPACHLPAGLYFRALLALINSFLNGLDIYETSSLSSLLYPRTPALRLAAFSEVALDGSIQAHVERIARGLRSSNLTSNDGEPTLAAFKEQLFRGIVSLCRRLSVRLPPQTKRPGLAPMCVCPPPRQSAQFDPC